LPTSWFCLRIIRSDELTLYADSPVPEWRSKWKTDVHLTLGELCNAPEFSFLAGSEASMQEAKWQSPRTAGDSSTGRCIVNSFESVARALDQFLIDPSKPKKRTGSGSVPDRNRPKHQFILCFVAKPCRSRSGTDPEPVFFRYDGSIPNFPLNDFTASGFSRMLLSLLLKQIASRLEGNFEIWPWLTF
jgi:hypothetical protein